MPEEHRTGIRALDEDIGGLPGACLTQVYGEPSAGKTTLGMAVARSNAPSALVLPEQPHPHRLAELLQDAAARVLVARPGTFQAQGTAVAKASKLLAAGKVTTVVVDSPTHLYRFEKMADTESLQAVFGQLHELRQAACRSGGAAVFTNQVRGGPRGPVPIGGPAVGHVSDVIVGLEVLDGPWRRARLEKHPYVESGRSWDLRLERSGFA